MSHLPGDTSDSGGPRKEARHETVELAEVPGGRHRGQQHETSYRSVRRTVASEPLKDTNNYVDCCCLQWMRKAENVMKCRKMEEVNISVPSRAGITVLRSASTNPRGEPNKKKPDTLNSSFPTMLGPSKVSTNEDEELLLRRGSPSVSEAGMLDCRLKTRGGKNHVPDRKYKQPPTKSK